MRYTDMTKEELIREREILEKKVNEEKDKGLKLNIARGKPSPDQISISRPILDMLNSQSDLISDDGIDCTNYGGFEGIDGAKNLIAGMMGTKKNHVIVMGNSSLNIMFDQISRAFTHGILGHTPWAKLDKVKWICPVPGYDRHFMITEHFGIEMINVAMLKTGPDMDAVEELVANDPAIKGMWCVPKYSNPTGVTFSNETVRRLASLKPAAPDFRIFYDNAYCVHDLYEGTRDKLIDIISESEKDGNADIVFEFASTSKISFPGGGISGVAASETNLADIKSHTRFQTIGYDKLNQLRHVRYFKDISGIREHMKKHAEFVRPRFEVMLSILHRELDGLGVGRWTEPNGGYFISFESDMKCATEIYDLCKEMGLTITNVGATYPYRKDPNNSNLRLAPTYPSIAELEIASEIFTTAVKLASINKLIG